MCDWQVQFIESTAWSPKVAFEHRFAYIFVNKEHSIVIELLAYFLKAVSQRFPAQANAVVVIAQECGLHGSERMHANTPDEVDVDGTIKAGEWR